MIQTQKGEKQLLDIFHLSNLNFLLNKFNIFCLIYFIVFISKISLNNFTIIKYK